jgi:hypothetical protein
VRSVVDPRKQRGADLLVASFELRNDGILVHVSEDGEVVLQNPPQDILDRQV